MATGPHACNVGDERNSAPWPQSNPIDLSKCIYAQRKDSTTMQKIQRTSIDNLAIAGHELSEEHLTLASGGYISSAGVGATVKADRYDLELYAD
jgi:hypothetical protein